METGTDRLALSALKARPELEALLREWIETVEHVDGGVGCIALLGIFLFMKQYQIIYADPPWRYDFSKSDSRKIENQYPTMSTEEICALAVPSAKDAALYLWATAPKLLESLEVMRAWGFAYKSQAVWDKRKIGMGYWFRGQHEILLVGTKGKFSPPEQGKHSKKPDEIRDLISAWYPTCEKLEMFCRFPAAGWDVFGNQVADTIALPNV